MRTVRFILVGWLVLGLASCGLRGTSTGGPPEPEVEATGHLGSASGGSADAHYAITSPFLQQGDRMTVVVFGEFPGRPLQPAAVLLLRLPTRTNFSRTGSGGEDGDRTYWEQRFEAAGETSYPARYEVRHKPVAEQLTLGEQPRLLGDGRLFLVDLTAQPVQVTQVKDDLQGLFADGEPGREQIKAAVDKLREKYDSVRGFTPGYR